MKRISFVLICLGLLGNAFAEPVKLYCWIVSYDNGLEGRTPQSISNLVSEVNQIYAQAAVNFEIESLSRTNSTYLACVDTANVTQYVSLCSIGSGTGGLEFYFVPRLEGGATAFYTSYGIVIGPDANARTVAHEIGHACGLSDIYDRRSETTLKVAGDPTRERMPDDYGWYPSSAGQTNIVTKLLMYGYKSEMKLDISFGDIYGLYYTNSWNRVLLKWDKEWQLGNAPVGFECHGNRHPMSL